MIFGIDEAGKCNVIGNLPIAIVIIRDVSIFKDIPYLRDAKLSQLLSSRQT